MNEKKDGLSAEGLVTGGVSAVAGGATAGHFAKKAVAELTAEKIRPLHEQLKDFKDISKKKKYVIEIAENTAKKGKYDFSIFLEDNEGSVGKYVFKARSVNENGILKDIADELHKSGQKRLKIEGSGSKFSKTLNWGVEKMIAEELKESEAVINKLNKNIKFSELPSGKGTVAATAAVGATILGVTGYLVGKSLFSSSEKENGGSNVQGTGRG